MKRLLRMMMPATILTLALAPNGAGETTPPHLGTALAEQRSLTRQRPNDAGAWNDLGNLLVLLGAFDEAESAYDAALGIAPSSTTTRFNLALLHQQRGDLEDAIADYRLLLESDPGNARAQYQLGAAYESRGQRQLAVDRYAAAFTLDPELLFAETNPHIIENGLVTESLIHARRSRRAGPQVPRTYDEAGRITAILVPAPPVLSTPPAPPSDATDTTDEGEMPSAAAEPSRPRAETSLGASAPRGDTRPDSAAMVNTQDRVLDSSDLRGRASNQVRGEAAAPGPAGAAGRRRGSATVTPTGGRRPALLQPSAGTETGFGIGQRSTGSLEWRLGPPSDAPVPAG
jgi:tetratricopeptide (TPR) repeat protein